MSETASEAGSIFDWAPEFQSELAANSEAARWEREMFDQVERQAEEAELELAARPIPSILVVKTMVIVLVLQQLAGLSIPFGVSKWKLAPNQPFEGDCFRTGSQNFTEVARLLRPAVPRSWTGTAAEGHADDISTLVTQAEKMATLDLEMERLIKAHAERVSNAQMGIGIAQDTLIVTFAVVKAIENVPHLYPAALNTARVACGAAVSAAVGLLGWILGTSVETEHAVEKLGYAEVTKEAKKIIDRYLKSDASASTPQSEGTVAPEFTHLRGDTSAPPAPSGTPTVAPAPAPASGSELKPPPRPEPLDPSADEGQRSGDAARPTPVAPSVPSAPVPNVAGVRQPAGQAGGVGAPGSRVNPPGPQVEDAEAVREDDIDDDAAAIAGIRGAGRAPVDAEGAAGIPGEERSAHQNTTPATR